MNRIRNTLTAAIRDQILLPKMVFIVPDDNFLTIINNSIYRSSILKRIEKILNWRMMEHSKLVSPKQGEMTKLSSFYLDRSSLPWHLPQQWDYTEVQQLPGNHRKVTWQTRFSFKSEEDMESIWYKSLHQRVSKTIAGYKSYWEAIDRTVKFCDITSLKRIAKKEMKYFELFNRNNDKFHWSRQEDRKPNDKRIEESLHLLQNHEYLSQAAKIFSYSVI